MTTASIIPQPHSGRLLDEIRNALENVEGTPDFDVATAFFTPSGLDQISQHMTKLGTVRLLIGVPEPHGAFAQKRHGGIGEEECIEEQARSFLVDFAAARDHMPHEQGTLNVLRHAAALAKEGRMVAAIYKRGFMHAKAYILHRGGEIPGSYHMGSSNLTLAGLTTNLELNAHLTWTDTYPTIQKWYDGLWDEAEEIPIAQMLNAPEEPHTPYDIYMRMLYEVHIDDLAEEGPAVDSLTEFQRHGATRALRIIDRIGGVLIADEVGLGKTFIAGQIIRHYQEKKQKVLLLYPAALRDTWKEFIEREGLAVMARSYQEFANEELVAQAMDGSTLARVAFNAKYGDIKLVVVDEAHNFRNPETITRGRVLDLLMQDEDRELAEMTATPVNNSLYDLKNLFDYFLRSPAALLEDGIVSWQELFDEASKQDPSDLDPGILYKVMDATTVKRTRAFIKKHYAHDRIIVDGRPIEITFPKPHALSVRYEMASVEPTLVDEVLDALNPDNQENGLKLVRYLASNYLKDEHKGVDHRENQAVGLIRSGLLKRFESSIHAFRLSIGRLREDTQRLADGVASGYVLRPDYEQVRFEADEDATDGNVTNKSASEIYRDPLSRYKKTDLEAAIEHDLHLLDRLYNTCDSLAGVDDQKISALLAELNKIARNASRLESAGYDTEVVNDVSKVIIFSFFADTVEYMLKQLRERIMQDPLLKRWYGDRIAGVAGTRPVGTIDPEKATGGFAPRTTKSGMPDIYNLLVTTDVLAEGVNLQQAANIINYDLPWNPMRMVQRHGRIDRLLSPHKDVYMRSFFPEDRLDALLRLEERINRKIAMAAATIGVVAPIEGASSREVRFSDDEKEIKKLYDEDATIYERAATGSAAETSEENRMLLRKALEKNAKGITNMAWRSHSGMSKGDKRGYVFCARVGETVRMAFVECDADWRAVDDGVQTGIGICLRRASCSDNEPRQMDFTIDAGSLNAWKAAQERILIEWDEARDGRNSKPVLPAANRDAAALLDAVLMNTSDEGMQRAREIVELPWKVRDQRKLRQALQQGSIQNKAAAIVKLAEGTGLRIPKAPKPLGPIQKDDIELVVWLAVGA